MKLPSNTRLVKYKDKMLSVSEIARIEGRARSTIRTRIKDEVYIFPGEPEETPSSIKPNPPKEAPRSIKPKPPTFVEKKRISKIKDLNELHKKYLKRLKETPVKKLEPPKEKDTRFGLRTYDGRGTGGMVQWKMTPEEMKKYFPDKK